MKDFNAKLNETPNEVLMEISGAIDANAKFPPIQTRKPVRVKFNDVALMNSYGIKVWCKWSLEHQTLPSISLEGCPFVFAKNFSSIRGFLMPNMKVLSFFVPFYNDDSHETKNVLMTENSDFFADGSFTIPKVADSRGAEMEMDVDKRSYFSFLKR